MATKAKTTAKTSTKPVASDEAAPKKAAAKKAPASKGGSATSTAIAVQKPVKGGAIVNIQEIQERLRQQAAAMNERTAPPGGIRIGVKQDKSFSLPSGEKVTELTACIVDFRTQHNFYPGAYDPKNIVPPVCFAVGANPKAMIPVADSPELQAESCQVCPMNQFGSAHNGDGKACKNERILALLPPNEDGTDVDADGDMWLLKVSPTALRAFDGYVQSLSRQHQLPPVAFLTTISFNPAVDYPQLMFADPVPCASVGEALARQAEAAELLEQKPDWAGFEAQAPAPKTNKTAPRKGGMARR